MDKYLQNVDTVVSSNPFEIHLLLLDTALANWRPYVMYLTVKIIDLVSGTLVRTLYSYDLTHG